MTAPKSRVAQKMPSVGELVDEYEATQAEAWICEHPAEAFKLLRERVKLCGPWIEPAQASSSDECGPFAYREALAQFPAACQMAPAPPKHPSGHGYVWWLSTVHSAHGWAPTLEQAKSDCDDALRADGWRFP